MSINPLSSILSPLSSSITNLSNIEPLFNVAPVTGATGSFADVFTEAFETANETDLRDKASAVELLAGQSDDMTGLLIDAQKAEIALNLTMQLRNKVVDAYNEIMRMQL